MSTDFFDGYQSAVLAVARIPSMADRQARQALLAEALGDLIDVPLKWNAGCLICRLPFPCALAPLR